MTHWLDSIRRALDGRRQPADIFIRDDDAGWDDARLLRLLDLVAAQGWPIDLAVIPCEAHGALATMLLERIEAGVSIGLHQHGYRHCNHEPSGRSWEFGPARDRTRQQLDIADGQARLRGLFGHHLDPFFTPPWNRCTRDTGEALVALGVRLLSRDVTAPPLSVPGLAELPVRVDWFARRKQLPMTRDVWAAQVAGDLAVADRPVGLMLHHAPMHDVDFADLAALLSVLTAHGARGFLMRDAVRAGAADEVSTSAGRLG